MDKPCQQRKAGSLEGLTEAQRERALHANSVYSEACKENGLRVFSWQNFRAWQDYVNGKINDTELSEKARTELDQFSKSFGKYVLMKKDDPRHAAEKTGERERAKRANKIYREVCGATGMTVCFFHDFISWCDFVEGKIDETEFYERVKEEIMEMAEEERN